ncbi:2877_t:CDS:2, partial [Dentiscutata erythropus]
ENIRRDDAIAELKAEVVKLRDDNEGSNQVTFPLSCVTEQASLNQDQESDTECSTSEKIPEVSNPMTEILAGAPLLKNSHRKKGAENISQMISDGIQNDAQSQKCILSSSNNILSQQSQISSTVPLLTLAQLFDKATDAEYGAIHANQEEILCWCYYGKKFITQVNEVTKGNKIGEKKAKGIIYDKMLEDLSILHKKRSEETEDESPTPEISAGGYCQNSAEVSELIAPIPITHGSNSLGNSSFTPQITPAESEKGTNEVQIVDDSDCSHDNDSEEERLDESDDDRYNRYDRYDEYGRCDRGYYYRDGRYKRKSSPMMSPIISPVTA